MLFGRKAEKGLSLRTIHIWLIVVAMAMSGVMLYSTYRLTANFRRIMRASEKHMAMEKAALELMDASDYLTERAQRFTINGDRRFMDDYFTEAYGSSRREDAIAKMRADENASAALEKLQKALDASVRLMDQEFYAMRLVIEAKGYRDCPERLQTVELTPEDAALSASDKLRRATEVMLNDEYYRQKDEIRSEMKASLGALETLTNDVDAEELGALNRELRFVRIIIALLILTIFCMVWLTSYLGINPVLTAVDRIKANSPIPEVGANEFRYLAQAYNKMYNVYRSSIEHLNFKASHDELTGAYNRAGYKLLLSGIDLESTYMLLFDVDNFKSINDTYGHETGDRVLIKLVEALKNNFRTDDYICRVGGDEFVVFMAHANMAQEKLIATKLEQITRELERSDDGLPPVTISVGVVHGTQAESGEELFKRSDAAMYTSKKQGKNTFTFYAK